MKIEKDAKGFRIKGWMIKMSPQMYWEIQSEIQVDKDKASFYLGLLLGTARPIRTKKGLNES